MKTYRVLAALLVLAVSALTARAQQCPPIVAGISPVAVQVGKTSECEVTAEAYFFDGASEVLVTGKGVTAEPALPPPKTAAGKPTLSKLKLRFTVAADAPLGIRDVRIITPRGASSLGQVLVVRDPVIVEKPDNDTMETAQAITLPATVCGTIEKPEDVDYFKFTVAAGAALTFNAYSARLQEKIQVLTIHTDLILTLKNSSGTVVAANDNFFGPDPLLHYRFPRAGEYYLEVRDVRYAGYAGSHWLYAIEINDRPFVTGVHPLAVQAGTTTRVQVLGYNLPDDAQGSVTVPAGTPEGVQRLMVSLGAKAAGPVPMVVTAAPVIPEAAGAKESAATAQALSVPACVAGRIDQPGESDWYAFRAKKGEQLSFEVVARRSGSPIDSLLRLRNDQGIVIGEYDDINVGYPDAKTGRHLSADSRMEGWTAPADGRYFLEVLDVHQRGGPRFAYLLKVTPSRPYFTLEVDTDKAILVPGTAGVAFVRAYRKNGFAGEIQLAAAGLPPGVTAHCGRILAAGQDGCIILKAAADARPGVANLQITGRATHAMPDGKTLELTASAQPLQETFMPGGGRGNYPVELFTVSVVPALDLKAVRISPAALTLKPGESKPVEVTIERAPGFTGAVSLDALLQVFGVFGNSLPEGVTLDESKSHTILNGTQTKGHLVFTAAADAKPVKDQQVPIMANIAMYYSAIRFIYASDPLLVTVTARP
jgi:hypothetical protein